MEQRLEYLQLYSRKCKTCKHLDPSEAKAYSTCHFSKGNEDCPAREIRFTIVGKANRMARQVLAARDARDAQAEAKILALVAQEDEAFRERFYFALESRQEVSA
ncbi:hypothetical protein BcepSauron_171 [Burkholderia phage BcepSauron]|uniref:Uncharacterized protein n=2 Tax=Sarumanvirus TaxID=2843450 RepID=A0A482MKI1_9CAUD|nr:hypothetical protein H1O16_gp173 [Burkholderia phage BcepSaruman]YP_009904549.1 hypothetical protein H1O17_gp171 [Burkholderia phage BcepSauron]QBQ74551.1 hypothetical protein BcepSauron_171 [Burkholderia phage BcepSauron]QBX06586.1 hypothetical protein BcepSaruman_173 [Burkholderia phage BcepSaruman]